MNRLRDKFVSDSSLPILFLDTERFTYFMNLYDGHLNTWSKYSDFIECVGSFNDEQSYFNHVKDVIYNASQYITSHVDYSSLINVNCNYTPIFNVVTRSIYHPDYVGKLMISIDMKSANFNAIHSVYPSIVNNKDSYAEFMKEFTPWKFLQESKQVRQTIFGKTEPRKLQSIQTSYIRMIADTIMATVPDIKISMMGSDEIVITDYPSDMEISDVYFLVLNSIHADYKKYYSVNIIDVEQVHPTRHYFNKREYDIDIDHDKMNITHNGYSKQQFKLVPVHYYAQVYKHYNDLALTPIDLMFMFDSKCVSFNEGLYD